jgi:hypothetical protein
MIAMMAVSTAQAVEQHNVASQNAETQGKAIVKADNLQAMDMARQHDQMVEAGADEANAHALQSQADLSTLDTLTGEFGGGNSADRARSVQNLQSNGQLATISRNATTGMSENAFAANAAKERTDSQLASIQKPSKAGMYLQIGAGAASAYGSYLNATALEKEPK